ncbi:hypothetical protein LSUE1_G007323 [Lachnellula suecica]|uniref:F-box domain-containing protein n=1 Tax=Lachnellula suecica TaxID=602035 RepID=A0A8T9C936_9HELO|nr:hypothetical protein LSUE1_G007323 [Lachnellula suecica]
MPALPNNKTRRKGVTPQKKPNKDHVWQRTLDIMGLEPLNASSSTVNTDIDIGSGSGAATNSSPPSTAAAPMAAPTSEKKTLTFLDLPVEAQKDIFEHSTTTDLLALCLVSKHFRDLAAEQLYRKFEVVFPDDSDNGAGSSTDALAGGLETLVTSDYDYARYLKDIVLEPMNVGDKGERAYRYYTYDSSCGKFMNTLFLMTLRKARTLETFKLVLTSARESYMLTRPADGTSAWRSAVQYSRHCTSLEPSNTSIYPSGTPPYDGSTGTPLIILPPPPSMGPPPGFGPPPHNPPSLSVTYPSTSWNLFPSGYKYAAKHQQKTTKSILPSVKNNPPTIGGFKHLKTLSVLDMDTLDYVDEIRDGIRNCSSTLTSLTLSFSETLANKSRKPPPEVHSDDDSEAEDEFGQLIPPPGPGAAGAATSNSELNGMSKVLQAQYEKRKQDDVLWTIFGLQTNKKPNVVAAKSEPDASPASKLKNGDENKLMFLQTFGVLVQRLMQEIKPGSFNSPEGKKITEMLRTAGRMYVDLVNKTNKASQSGSSSKETPTSSTISADGMSEDNVVMSGGADANDEPGLFDEDPKKKIVSESDPEVANPEDIDIEEPEGELAIEFDDAVDTGPEADSSNENPPEMAEIHEPVDAEESNIEAAEGPLANQSSDTADLVNKLQLHEQIAALVTSHTEIQHESMRLRKHMVYLQDKMAQPDPSPADFQALVEAEAQFRQVSVRVNKLRDDMEALNELVDDVGLETRSEALVKSLGEESARISEYVRATRGLTLDTLAIYLIPVRAVVLNSAIDLHALRSLTLLNVGPQAGIWNLLYKENKTAPLPLSKIFSDNVTISFLQCVSELEVVTELLLLEKQKGRVESTAAKTTVTIDFIRKSVLKKHAGTLKVLMIKNDSSAEWDLNVKTVMLLCHRAKQLEELSVSFPIKTMHCLLQAMPGLTSLRALHCIQFRTDDRCSWAIREWKKFTADAVAHNPSMALEYLALDQSVDRLVRRSKPKTKADKKGKGKASSVASTFADIIKGLDGKYSDDSVGGPYTPGPNYDWLATSSDEEADAMSYVGKLGLRIETIENIRFGDITGVRIFEKDVIGGRL